MCWVWECWARASLGTAGPPLESNTHIHEHSCSEGCSDRLVFSLSVTSTPCLHCPPSVELVCVSHSITSSSPMGHASWNGFPHIGHYHVKKECYYYLNLFAPPFIKGGKGGQGGQMHSMICRLQCKLHTGELFSTSCTHDGHMEVTHTRLFCMMHF